MSEEKLTCTEKKEPIPATDNLEKESLTETFESDPCNEEQKEDPVTEELEIVTPLSNTVKEKPAKKTDWFQIFVGIAQILAVIATVVYANFAWMTLNEMKTERDNAYHPEIVVTPGLFEGGLVSEDKIEIDGNSYMYVDYILANPAYCYGTNPNQLVNENNCIFLEKPYLTIKNIGVGAAKDIRVTFSIDWLDKAILKLNDNSFDFKYSINEVTAYSEQHERKGFLNCTVNGEDHTVTEVEEITKQIQYMGCDDSIKIMLPEHIYNILALYFYQNYKANLEINRQRGHHQFSIPFHIPDLEILIECYDMQGEKMDDKQLAIPWTMYYKAERSESDGLVFGPVYLRSCFYEDFIDERVLNYD
ncbi:hypothetical protein SAMN04487833_13324 [Sarcina sp. DSM 11001]|uniref:hypothetical protein n=1 Tax=Sarcina sp. DSM 11001 TaxID=1798184 RepID=UPI00088E99D1|nr:hypothetical protein [Sarcina sp. DSM 11001]SDL82284.1 hypothetical protein SAMN04487833_13324 [Sarcina sp. DSM 11001]